MARWFGDDPRRGVAPYSFRRSVVVASAVSPAADALRVAAGLSGAEPLKMLAGVPLSRRPPGSFRERLVALGGVSMKTSIKTKRLLAATSDEFRATLLGFELPEEDDEDNE